MLRSNAKLIFSELYMNVLPEGSWFFKRLNILIYWEGMEKEIRKIYQKGGNKRLTFL
ncbi:MAG: hypothetical protein ACMUEL_08525 [Flavobacteriales bacterium Tduv]